MTGRPSKYQPEYAEQAKKLCRLGATDADLAEFFGVSVRTIANWKDEFSDFLQALKDGKTASDAKVANSLYHRARGYRWQEQQAIKVKEIEYANGKKAREIERVELVDVERTVPPDTTACIFWLKNRRSADWRDKTEHHHTHDVTKLSDAELERIAAGGQTDNAALSGNGVASPEAGSGKLH
jgi:hypothetical protein